MSVFMWSVMVYWYTRCFVQDVTIEQILYIDFQLLKYKFLLLHLNMVMTAALVWMAEKVCAYIHEFQNLFKSLLFHHYLCRASVFVLLLVFDWAWVCQCKYCKFAYGLCTLCTLSWYVSWKHFYGARWEGKEWCHV